MPAILAGLVAYFGLLLLPEWFPGIGRSSAFFGYLLSVPLLLATLLVFGVWGGIGLLRPPNDGPQSRRRARNRVVVSLAGLLCFGSIYGLSAYIRGALPSGSHLRKFDRAEWRDPRSSAFVPGDITVRQKMLGDVVSTVLPGRSRGDIEQLLGPSLDTPYFKNTGRDLIYILGAERGSMFSIDSEWLLIWFDDSGRLERYEIRTD